MSEEVNLKILVLGDTNVGKTSLILKYVDGFFPELFLATIGDDYKEKKIKMKGMNINLQIWDTCGQERYRSLSSTFIKSADGIIFVYDVTDVKTFQQIKYWMNQSDSLSNHFKKILVGNKVDLPEEKWQVKKEKVIKYINEQKMDVYETSAKNGKNVNEIFKAITDLIISNMSNEEIIKKFSNNDNKTISTANNNKKPKCC